MHSGEMHIFPGSPGRLINMLEIGGVEDRYFIPYTSIFSFLEVGERRRLEGQLYQTEETRHNLELKKCHWQKLQLMKLII